MVQLRDIAVSSGIKVTENIKIEQSKYFRDIVV